MPVSDDGSMIENFDPHHCFVSIRYSFGQVNSMRHVFSNFSKLDFSATRLFDKMMYSMAEIEGKGRLSLIIIRFHR